MTDTEKLSFLLRAIVTANGPDQQPGESDEVFLLRLANWLLITTVPVTADREPDCHSGTDSCKLAVTTLKP